MICNISRSSAGIPRDSWDEIINSMKQYGLRIPAEQRARILDYLDTYLGPNPPPAAESATQPAAAQTAKVDGKTVFEEQCAACHQPNGQGVADQFPPLARNADVFLAPDFPLHVVLFGIKGKITVNGQKFDSAMPPLDVLSDAEIAAVVGYVRQNFGNAALRPQDMGTVDAASVAAVRGKTQSPEEVLAYREKLKAIRASR